MFNFIMLVIITYVFWRMDTGEKQFILPTFTSMLSTVSRVEIKLPHCNVIGNGSSLTRMILTHSVFSFLRTKPRNKERKSRTQRLDFAYKCGYSYCGVYFPIQLCSVQVKELRVMCDQNWSMCNSNKIISMTYYSDEVTLSVSWNQVTTSFYKGQEI